VRPSSDDPPDFIVDQFAAVYVSSGRVIREVVRAIFLSPEFYEAHTRKTWVRSPVEYAVAQIRMLEGTTDFSSAVNSLSGMGQVLFIPEDAKGWDWGTSWMNTGTLFARALLANTFATNRGSSGTRFDTKLLAGRDASTAEKVVDILADRLNISDVAPDVRATWIAYVNANDDGSRGAWTNTVGNVDKKVRGLVHLMLTSPAFHLAYTQVRSRIGLPLNTLLQLDGKLALRWWGLNPRKAQATLLPVLMIVPSTSIVRRGNLSRSISS
jgi:hypothetical protein